MVFLYVSRNAQAIKGQGNNIHFHRRLSVLILVTFIVKCSEVIEQLQGPHQRLWCRWIHEVKMHEIVNAKLLQLQHN